MCVPLCPCVVLLQAMRLDPPLLPHQLFRRLAREAWVTNQAAKEAAAASSSNISSAYYSAPSGEGVGGLGAADFDLGGVGGDIFAGSGVEGFAGGAGGGGDDDAGGDAGVEDEDMQAAGYTA